MVNSNFHLIQSKTLPTNDFELTFLTCIRVLQKLLKKYKKANIANFCLLVS